MDGPLLRSFYVDVCFYIIIPVFAVLDVNILNKLCHVEHMFKNGIQ